ncbi:hypothetical protein [Flavobacterium subsaxonicum]|uniref:Beta-lactamase-inhibitor-like PepSY-like domain-containing protein n=1 Tax=Flavobacterium subsaxonicum WB 4.1-42 = DSM 21790 TaxID=1121898 RepID=A0A0A2MUL0_9FLAO|nr:hypothetical protein [Flavobacterium subsaxonicum]KGO91910.1 hypothetical protein Q766_15840 [Flavobacterium subsaxonicum WB 4.1-42 = DSM 21790]
MKNLFLALAVMAGVAATATTIKNNSTTISVNYQEKQYKKIQVSEVSKEALDKIKKSYGNYTIKEAHKADDGEYKLVLAKDGVDLTATFTPAGDLIKIY